MNALRQSQYAFLAFAMLALSACTTTPVSVIQTACTREVAYSTERCAKGIAETYEAHQKRAEEIVTDPLTPAEVKQAAKAADAVASPVMVSLLKATAAYVRIKTQVAAGQTPEEQLAIAHANLEAWVQQAIPLIKDLENAVKGARK